MITTSEVGWWKFTSYELREGYIRPTPGAKLQSYSPWEGWRATGPLKQGRQPPYQLLFQLLTRRPGPQEEAVDVSNVPTVEPPERLLSPPGEDLGRNKSPSVPPPFEVELLRWCRRYGLLGLFPHLFSEIELGQQNDEAASQSQQERMVGLRHVRTNRGWVSLPGFRSENRSPLAFGRANLNEKSSQWQPLTVVSSRFFPDLPDSGLHLFGHQPFLSDEFWRSYAEPLGDFLTGAFVLRNAVLGSNQGVSTSIKSSQGPDLLDALIEPTGVTIERTKPGNRLLMTYTIPSLLSALAVMVRDLERGHALQCPTCRSVFISARPQSRYCSLRCRWTGQQRNYRAGKTR